MAANSLASASPASTVAQLLHIGTGTLAAGAPLRLGDGSATCLTLSTAGLTVAGTLSATTATIGGITLTRLGTVARAQALADAPGTLHPVIRAIVAATATNYTTTPAGVTLTWENGSALAAGTYRLRGFLACQSAAAATGTQIRLDGPTAQTSLLGGTWSQTSVPQVNITAWGTTWSATTSPAANIPYMQTLDGVLTLTADSATVPSVWFNSGGTAGAVKILAGSFIEFERLL